MSKNALQGLFSPDRSSECLPSASPHLARERLMTIACSFRRYADVRSRIAKFCGLNNILVFIE